MGGSSAGGRGRGDEEGAYHTVKGKDMLFLINFTRKQRAEEMKIRGGTEGSGASRSAKTKVRLVFRRGNGNGSKGAPQTEAFSRRTAPSVSTVISPSLSSSPTSTHCSASPASSVSCTKQQASVEGLQGRDWFDATLSLPLGIKLIEFTVRSCVPGRSADSYNRSVSEEHKITAGCR